MAYNTALSVRFDASGAKDLVTDNTWTNMGNLTYATEGKFGNRCGLFNNGTSYLRCNKAITISGDFTIAFWNKRSGVRSEYTIVLGESVNGATNSVQLEDRNSSGGLCIRLSGSIHGNASATTYLDGNWHHYAITRKGSTIYFFVDGTLKGTSTGTNNLNLSSNAFIGKWGYTSSTSGNIGYLDDIVILREALWTSSFSIPTNYLLSTTYKLYLNMSNQVYGVVNGAFSKLSDNWNTLSDLEKYNIFISTNFNKATAEDLLSMSKFKILSLSIIDTPYQSKITAVSNDQLVLPLGLINTQSFEGIDKVSIVSSVSGDGNCKIIVTEDLITYKTYDFESKAWQHINHNDVTQVEVSGIDIAQIQNIPRSAWDELNLTEGIGFAYLLAQENTSDICKIDELTLQVDMKGSWDKAIHGTDYKYGYPQNNILRVQLLTNGNYKINYSEGEKKI